MVDSKRSQNTPGQTDSIHDKPKRDPAPGQSTASDWDMDKTKPSSAQHDDANRAPVGGQHNEQNPQLKRNKP